MKTLAEYQKIGRLYADERGALIEYFGGFLNLSLAYHADTMDKPLRSLIEASDIFQSIISYQLVGYCSAILDTLGKLDAALGRIDESLNSIDLCTGASGGRTAEAQKRYEND